MVRWLTGHLMVVVVCCVGPHSRGSVEVGSDGELLIGSRIENFPILFNVISLFLIIVLLFSVVRL